MIKSIYEQIRITEDAIDSLKRDEVYAEYRLNKAIDENNHNEIGEFEEWLRDIRDEIQYRNEDLTELLREFDVE